MATFEPVMTDVRELQIAHHQLRTGERGRQWGLGGVNRGAVALILSAWEAYVEDVALECVDAIRPATATASVPAAWPHDAWPALRATTVAETRRLHTPSAQNVRNLFRTATGLADVTARWVWRGCANATALAKLDDLLTLRHQIVHGIVPRPNVQYKYVLWAQLFIERVVERTDEVLRDHLVTSLGVAAPW
jgi:hypothetical protein